MGIPFEATYSHPRWVAEENLLAEFPKRSDDPTCMQHVIYEREDTFQPVLM